MPGLTFIEYVPKVHTAVREAGMEIREKYSDDVEEFLEEVRENALNRSYFLESIGFANYDADQKIEWELQRIEKQDPHSIPGYEPRIYPDIELDSFHDDISVYNYSSDLEILEDIDIKFNTLRSTPATSVTLTNEEVKVFNKHVQFNK